VKVLIFTSQFFQLGGAERLSVELAEALNKHGIHADILSQYSEDLPGVKKATARLKSYGIPSILFLNMQIRANILSLPKSIKRLRQIVEEGQYNIIETSSLTPSLITGLAFWDRRVRHVVGLHDVFLRDRHAGFKYNVWRSVMRLNGNNRFYAISEYVRSCWLEYSGIKPELTRKILNSVNDNAFVLTQDNIKVRKELDISENSRILLFVGRLLKRKGIDTVLEAVGPILEQYNAYLLYVGSDAQPPEGFFPDEIGLLDRLYSTVQNEVWGSRVRFLGSREDLPRLMAASDALVHPARIEGFGLVLAEALAAGLPVIASNIQGIPEVLAGTESIMVPPDDPLALRKAVIKTLKRSSDANGHVIAQGRKRAESFRTSQRAQQMIRLMEDVLSNKL
jgi:glycosyltransferase involved in cell wall biosynthesis